MKKTKYNMMFVNMPERYITALQSIAVDFECEFSDVVNAFIGLGIDNLPNNFTSVFLLKKEIKRCKKQRINQ